MIVLCIFLIGVGLFLILLANFKRRARIPDNARTFQEIGRDLIRAGLEVGNLILAVDFTKSNATQGERTFGGRHLHDVSDPKSPNPYMRVISALGKTLEELDHDHLIPCYIFGDEEARDNSVVPFWPDERDAMGFDEALERYETLATSRVFAGGTNFAPVLEKAMDICALRNQYHILVIITDGQLTSPRETYDLIVRAAKHSPLSIIIVGVGDGPFDQMHHLDDALDERPVDNVRFVEWSRFDSDESFAAAACQELATQFKFFREAGRLGSR